MGQHTNNGLRCRGVPPPSVGTSKRNATASQTMSYIAGFSKQVYGPYAGDCVQVTPTGGEVLKKQFPALIPTAGKPKSCMARTWRHQVNNPAGVGNGSWYAR